MIDDEKESSVSTSKPIKKIAHRKGIPRQSFGPKVKTASQGHQLNFKHLKISLSDLNNGNNIHQNICNIAKRIDDLNDNELESIENFIPYDIILGFMLQCPPTFDFTPILLILSKFANKESFPCDKFINEAIITLILNLVSTIEGAHYRIYAYAILCPVVRANTEVRDVLVKNGLLRLLFDDKVPIPGIDLLFSFAFSEPSLPVNANRQIYFTFLNIIQNGHVQNVLHILNYIQQGLPTIEGILNEYGEYLAIRLQNSHEKELVRRAFELREVLEIPDEAATQLLLESIIFHVNKPESTQDYKKFLLWAVSTLINIFPSFNQETITNITKFFHESFSSLPYNVQTVIVKAYCLIDNSFLMDNRCIDALSMFVTNGEIGAHCVMKLASIIKMNNEISNYAVEKCLEIDEEISDMMTSEDVEVANAAALLSSILENIQK